MVIAMQAIDFVLLSILSKLFEKVNEISEILMGHGRFEAVGHEGASSAFEFLEGLAWDLSVGAIEKAKGQVVGVFREHTAEERSAVSQSDGVTGIGGVDRLVGTKNGTKKSFLGSIGDGSEIGSVHGKLSRGEVADGAQFCEDLFATPAISF